MQLPSEQRAFSTRLSNLDPSGRDDEALSVSLELIRTWTWLQVRRWLQCTAPAVSTTTSRVGAIPYEVVIPGYSARLGVNELHSGLINGFTNWLIMSSGPLFRLHFMDVLKHYILHTTNVPLRGPV